MEYKEFVEATVCRLTQPVFNENKDILLGEHISFSIIDHDAVTIDVMAEKICDYFGMLEIKTGKSFDKRIEAYINDLDSITSSHIAKAPQAKKGDTTPVIIPRARKYYEKVQQIKGVKKPAYTQLIDFSRIMMCLYVAVIQNKGKHIENFEFSAECLDPKEIIAAVKNEETAGVLSLPTKKRFDTTDLYSSDTCSLIIMILFLWALVNGKVQGDTDHE